MTFLLSEMASLLDLFLEIGRPAEIGELYVEFPVEQDILRFDVPVHDPLLVDVPERLRNLLDELRSLFFGKSAIRLG